MKWKRSKKAAQEAKQACKSPSQDASEGKLSDQEFDSDSNLNYTEAESSKSNIADRETDANHYRKKIHIVADESRLWSGCTPPKTIKSSHESEVDTGRDSPNGAKWSASVVSRHLVECGRSSMNSPEVITPNSPSLTAHSAHLRPSTLITEPFYRHFVS